jgi:integrase
MTPRLASELRKHKLASPNSELDLIFSNSEGGWLDPEALIRKEFLPALRRAKVRQIIFNDISHINKYLRTAGGQNIKYIQRQLGHASITTTLDRYGHLIKEVDMEEAKKLDNGLGFAEQSGDVSDSVRSLLEEKVGCESKSLNSLKDFAEPIGMNTPR